MGNPPDIKRSSGIGMLICLPETTLSVLGFWDRLSLVAWFARIDSHDSRESGDMRESEIRMIRATRPDAL